LGKRYGEQGQGSGKMPGFGSLYTEEQIKAIVEYVRGL
jgi:mono/diheme cytochrome c family protein